jgi:hypothetical protein
MDAKEYVGRQITSGRRLVDGALTDCTDEQFCWAPPGTANTIAATVVHMAFVEDMYVMSALQGKPRLWETGNWSEKLGLSAPPVRDGWAEANGKQIPMAPVLAYLAAARAATDEYIATIGAEELDRSVEVRGAQRPVADIVATVAVHPVEHAGEIAALKGIQGAKGMPF